MLVQFAPGAAARSDVSAKAYLLGSRISIIAVQDVPNGGNSVAVVDWPSPAVPGFLIRSSSAIFSKRHMLSRDPMMLFHIYLAVPPQCQNDACG